MRQQLLQLYWNKPVLLDGPEAFRLPAISDVCPTHSAPCVDYREAQAARAVGNSSSRVV